MVHPEQKAHQVHQVHHVLQVHPVCQDLRGLKGNRDQQELKDRKVLLDYQDRQAAQPVIRELKVRLVIKVREDQTALKDLWVLLVLKGLPDHRLLDPRVHLVRKVHLVKWVPHKVTGEKEEIRDHKVQRVHKVHQVLWEDKVMEVAL